MKRKVIVKLTIISISLLLFGAVTVETVSRIAIEPKILTSWSDLYGAYNSRPSTPPLPDIKPLTIYKMIQSGDWSFMTNNWFRTESGGTYYVSRSSKELQNLKLPLTVRVYDYLPENRTYILSSSDGEKFKSEAAFKSEPLTDGEFEKLSEEEQLHVAFL